MGFVSPPIVFTRKSQSLGNTIAVNSAVTFAHGLDNVPKLVTVNYRCVTADAGYSVGDVISSVGSDYDHNAGARGCSLQINATNVVARFSGGLNAFPNKGTFTNTVITMANWVLDIYAYY